MAELFRTFSNLVRFLGGFRSLVLGKKLKVQEVRSSDLANLQPNFSKLSSTSKIFRRFEVQFWGKKLPNKGSGSLKFSFPDFYMDREVRCL